MEPGAGWGGGGSEEPFIVLQEGCDTLGGGIVAESISSAE